MEYEGITQRESLRYRLVFDARMLTARSDEGPAATGAWDRLTLSDAAYLRSNGFQEEDYPEEEERRRRLVEKVLMSDPGTFGPLLLPELYPELGDLFGRTGQPKPATGQGVPPVEGETPAPSPESGPPVGGPPEVAPSGELPEAASPGALAADGLLVDELTRAANAALGDLLTVGSPDAPAEMRLRLMPVAVRVQNYLTGRGVEPEFARLRAEEFTFALETNAFGQSSVSADLVRQALAGAV